MTDSALDDLIAADNRSLPVLVSGPARTIAEIVRRQMEQSRWPMIKVRAVQERRAALAKMGE